MLRVTIMTLLIQQSLQCYKQLYIDSDKVQKDSTYIAVND